METNLAATSAARKERLIALRKRKQAAETGNGANGGPSHFAFKQRNYDPETRQHRKREAGEAGEDTVENAVEGLAEQIIREDEEKRKEELDLFNIQPRRANWDLKRDMTNRMSKLERKTNEAIATIFRQRLQAMRKDAGGGGGEVDILASINAAEHERDEAAEADERAAEADSASDDD
ncbi:cwf18 pre-mRNA splicing factor-domain-containing protein [Naematelia encephala]|uniref:Cwf18 pre-mRNA splicing factor-domain-containing protein n=1 Tax=Naematelia encephala TaxID=71784 RepID=A0A1Y2B564_9TREE|nr:cwf18 pre-mRNA splicing factor-domain-containing protein [Naematelia encephala]